MKLHPLAKCAALFVFGFFARQSFQPFVPCTALSRYLSI